MKTITNCAALMILLCGLAGNIYFPIASTADDVLRASHYTGGAGEPVIASNPLLPKSSRSYDEDGDRIFESLNSRMAFSGSKEVIPVIVLFKERTLTAGTYATQLMSITGVQQVTKSYRNLPAVAASLTGEQIKKLSKNPGVEHIQLDGKTRASMFTAQQWFGVIQLQAQFHPPDYHFLGDRDGILGNYSKDDVVVAVTDTGINANHPDLRKVLAWADYVNGQPNPYDDNGHGTEVSGIIAGTGKKTFIYDGVAPEAALVVAKVLNKDGAGTEATIISAIDDIITNRAQFNIRVLNISIEVPGSSNGQDAFSQICNRASSAGIVVVIAAGNEGPAARTIGDGAAANSAITVGAGADLGEGGFFLADFSSRGPTADGRIKPDLWGPGVRIHTTSKGGAYVDATGTSFAAPFVAGVAAMMISANPSLRPATIKSMLTSTAVRWGSPARNNEAGFGRLQVYQAGTRAAGITQNLDPPAVPRAGYATGTLNAGQVRDYPLQITTKYRIALTLIVLNHPAADLDLYLLDDKGAEIARGFTLKRQETVTLKPTRGGAYTVRVRAANNSASSSYVLNISADWSQ